MLQTMKRYSDQVCLKLAGPLRAHIRQYADEQQRSESWVIRKLLIEFFADRAASAATTQREAA
jgi:hypothetical protein